MLSFIIGFSVKHYVDQKLDPKYLRDPDGGITVEPRFNEPLFNEVLDITNDILCPGQSYSKMYGMEPRYNEPRYNEFFDITNIIRKPKRKI